MRGWELELAMRELAKAQHGVISCRQARGLSSSADALRWRLRSPGFKPIQVHVTRANDASSRANTRVSVHESRYLPRHHWTLVDGIPVTTVARTVFDFASCVHPSRAERALDNALTRKLVDLESMRATTIELLRPGRTGSALMRQLLAVRGAGYIPPASGTEARVLALLAAAGIEMPECQVDLGGDVWIGRVGLLLPAAPLGDRGRQRPSPRLQARRRVRRATRKHDLKAEPVPF